MKTKAWFVGLAIITITVGVILIFGSTQRLTAIRSGLATAEPFITATTHSVRRISIGGRLARITER